MIKKLGCEAVYIHEWYKFDSHLESGIGDIVRERIGSHVPELDHVFALFKISLTCYQYF